MSRICVFPGTFDPVTLGHTDIIDRAVSLFDKLVIAIGINSTKQPMFPLEKRMQWCELLYQNDPRISVESYEGLTVDFCRKIKATYLLRGIRFASDFDYEKSIATLNRALRPEIETIFLAPSPAYANLASTLVREVILHDGDASAFLPKTVNDTLSERLRSS